MQTMYNPDQWAALAKRMTHRGIAVPGAVWAIRSKADWVLINGKWRSRAAIMRA